MKLIGKACLIIAGILIKHISGLGVPRLRMLLNKIKK
jgi:hypothetical protein